MNNVKATGLSYGIDLGTTNSAIAVLRGKTAKAPTIIKQKNGKNTLPSCVMWSKEEGFKVGTEAYKQRWKNNVVYSTKKFMGGTEPVTLTDEQGNQIKLKPEEVGAEVIKELVRAAQNEGYADVKDVTITVPAYFDEHQRRATMKAGELAGLNVVAIINEPTSASLSYGMGEDVEGNILVYDLGGGTFDVTLLKIIKDKGESQLGLFDFGDEQEETTTVRVLSNSGNAKLGGDDIDEEAYESAVKRFNRKVKETTGVTYNFNKEATEEQKKKVLYYVEQLKKNEMGFATNVELTLTVAGIEWNLEFQILKEDINKGFEKVFKQTMVHVQECIATSSEKEFQKIVLVGGSTKSEYIKERIKEQYAGVKVYDGLNPDESIALGAAVQTGIKKGDSDMVVFDVLPLPIGVEVSVGTGVRVRQGIFQQLLSKDTLLPASVKHSVTTVVDNQKVVTINMYQGLNRNVEDNTFLGGLVVDNLPEGKAGEVDLTLTAKVDTNGTLTVLVTVDGKTYEKILTQVNNIEEKKVERPNNQKEKRIKRWTENSKEWDLTADEKESFDIDIGMYKDGIYSDKEMSEKIKTYSKKNRDKMLQDKNEHVQKAMSASSMSFGGE